MYELNDLAYWYPLIKDLVKTPKTEVVRTNICLSMFLDGECPEGWMEFKHEMSKAAKRLGGCPLFLRTGHTSDKHSWRRTCYLPTLEKLPQHIIDLVEWSVNADLMGLPYGTWVLRELLPTEPIFHAWEKMPITREFRYFVEDGKIVHRQPYWPPGAFERIPPEYLPGDWRQRLAGINSICSVEEAELSAKTELVGQALGGYWSVDWLQSGGQWYLIDMAMGEMSYKWGTEDSK